MPTDGHGPPGRASDGAGAAGEVTAADPTALNREEPDWIIQEVEAIPVEVPRSGTARSALGTHRTTRAAVVRLRLANGVVGVGEISMVFNGGGASLARLVEERLGPAVV